MKDLVERAVTIARSLGASYSDSRGVLQTWQTLAVQNGEIRRSVNEESLGLGIRVLVGGAWGFAATDDLSPDSVESAVHQAVRIARAGASVPGRRAELAPEEKHLADWTSPCRRDPFKVPLEEKLDLMFAVDRALRGVKGVTSSRVDLGFRRSESTFASSVGSLITQRRTQTGAGFTVGAYSDGEYQTRSYPTLFGGQWSLRGYELVNSLDLLGNAVPRAEESVALLSAAPCPSGEMDIILEGSHLGLVVHESVGHATELDRALGTEANYAGTTWATTERLGRLQYGSDLMNVVADARPEHGDSPGCFAFDDEGVPARRIDIVKEGMLAGYMSSRETARRLGLPRSGGCMRATSWNRLPLVRMTQVSLLPGEWELEDLIADTRDGILMATTKSWSIDDKRLNLQFGCEIGWRIKNGKRAGLVRNPTHAGITPRFWGSMDAVCNRKHWALWGIPHCSKGHPRQAIGVGHGAAPARFRKVAVGVAGP